MAVKSLPAAVTATLGLFYQSFAAALQPSNVLIGPLFVTPTLELETAYTDNLWLTDTREKDTWLTRVTPRVQGWLYNGASDYSVAFQAEDSTYLDSGDDDYTDYTTNLDIHQEFNAKNTLNLFAEYYDGHETRGQGFIEGELSLITDKPIEYELSTFGGDYTYGGEQSRGRVKLAGKSADFDYQNYRDFTRFYDRTEDTFAGTFFWKIAARTDALLEARLIDNNYSRRNPADPGGSLTNEEMNYLLGVSWEATGKTSGHVKLGMYDRQYDSGSRGDEDGFLWEVGVVYQPRTYSTLDLKTSRFYQAPNGLGDGINTREVTLDWDHGWSQRSSTRLGFGYANDNYEGGNREDNSYRIEARCDYAFRRWMDVGLGYRYQYRDSDREVFDYNANTVFLEARLSL